LILSKALALATLTNYNLWCLVALYLNEKADAANARLFQRAKDYIASQPTNVPRT
jgi:hypothetical protein